MEWIGADDLGIEELDTNPERVAKENECRNTIKKLPYDEQLKHARSHYYGFVANYDKAMSDYDKGIAAGKTVQDLLDDIHSIDD